MTVSEPSALPASERPSEHAWILSEGAIHRLSGSRSNRLISILLPVKRTEQGNPGALEESPRSAVVCSGRDPGTHSR